MAHGHSPARGWPRSVHSGGSRSASEGGDEKVCRQKVLNKLCFLLLLLLLSALSVCVAGVQRKSQTNSDAFPCSVWAKSEKALMAAFVEGLQYRLIL